MADHPSVLINQRLIDLNWAPSDLVHAMPGGNYKTDFFFIPLYIEKGEKLPHMRIAERAKGIEMALGIDAGILFKTERAWVRSYYIKAVKARFRQLFTTATAGFGW
jgi:hypothetical protein